MNEHASPPDHPCPIPNTHRRLDQAHRLWHQTLCEYSDPEGFRANLNSTIEALRNVTFMLQSEKAGLPEFAEWYGSWQDRMKLDVFATWLSQARTVVVHQSDLETHSVAHATLHTNLNLAAISLEVSPFAPTDLIAALLADRVPEPFASTPSDLVLAVERQWVVKDFPQHELLEVLARVHGLLVQLVADAHARAGHSYTVVDHDHKPVTVSDGRLPCMLTTAESRTARIVLADRSRLTPKMVQLQRDPVIDAKAKKRYGFHPAPQSIDTSDPVARAEIFVEWSKRVLAKDKYHDRMMFARTPDGWGFMKLDAEDRPQKYALMRFVADQLKQWQADAIIEIGEIWMSTVAEAEAGRMPEVAKGRVEALMVTVVTKSGTNRRYITPFKRGLFGRITFEATTAEEHLYPAYLSPIYELWNLRPGPADPAGGSVG